MAGAACHELNQPLMSASGSCLPFPPTFMVFQGIFLPEARSSLALEVVFLFFFLNNRHSILELTNTTVEGSCFDLNFMTLQP